MALLHVKFGPGGLPRHVPGAPIPIPPVYTWGSPRSFGILWLPEPLVCARIVLAGGAAP